MENLSHNGAKARASHLHVLYEIEIKVILQGHQVKSPGPLSLA